MAFGGAPGAGAVGFPGGVFAAALPGFFTAFVVAVFVALPRATAFLALPFAFLVAINASSSRFARYLT